jgi:hypothetical protein
MAAMQEGAARQLNVRTRALYLLPRRCLRLWRPPARLRLDTHLLGTPAFFAAKYVNEGGSSHEIDRTLLPRSWLYLPPPTLSPFAPAVRLDHAGGVAREDYPAAGG